MIKKKIWIFLLLILISFGYSVNAQVPAGNNLLDELVNKTGAADSTKALKAAVITFRNPRIPSVGSKNLVPNASFELGTTGWSSIGKSTGWGGDLCSLYGEIDTIVFKDGKRSLRIDLWPGKTEITYFDVWPMSRQAQTNPRAANRGWIDVIPGQKYTLSAYMRSDRNGIPALMSIYQSAELPDLTGISNVDKNLILSNVWIRYSITITASNKQLFIALGPNLANETDSATVWIDAVQLEQAASPTDFQFWSACEIALNTGKFGNIFETGQTVSVKLTGTNHSAAEVSIPVQCDITDYFDSKVYSGSKQVVVGAGSELEMDWPLPVPGNGFYNVRFSWKYVNNDYSQCFPFALINPYTWDDSRFGVNHSPTTASTSHEIQKAGVKWDRNWSVNWGLLEPVEGNLSFVEADKQILNAQKIGYKSLALLPPLPAPNWGSTAPASVSPSMWNRMSYMPSDVNKLMNFITVSINHYKDKVKYWEFLNEPIWTSFCLPGTYYNMEGADYIPADYIGLLKKAYTAMKAADPSCFVIGGFSAEPWRYTKEFIAADGLKNIDILNIHNYGGFAPPESYITEMDTLLSQMDRGGGRKPIWITEYAYYGVDSLPWTPWKAPANVWGANLLLKDERQCSDWTIRYNTIMFARGVEKVFYHEAIEGLINDGMLNTEFAFLGEEGVPRKLYPAHAAMAHILGPQFTFAGMMRKNLPPENLSTHQLQAYSFQCNEKAVLIAWISEKESSVVHLGVPVGADIFNIAGLKINSPTGILLSNSPVYIVSDSLTASELLDSCNITIKTFKVDVVVKDAKSNLPLPGITVSLDNQEAVSDPGGIAHFSKVSNIFVLNIRDSHYNIVETSHSIVNDTSINVSLTWKGRVTLTLQDQKTHEKFWGVSVSFGSATQVSDLNGQVVFSVERGTYEYSINKISYKPVTGIISIDADTSIIFSLERLYAYAKFRLKDGITPVNNAIVKINSDSLVTNSLGIAQFKNLPVDNSYSYTIKRDGYYDVSGEFYLVDDTLIDILLEKNTSGADQLIDKSKIRIWPNPFSDLLHCSFPPSGSDNTVIISDLVGNLVFSDNVKEYEINISLRNIPSGAYIVRIYSKNDELRQLFFKN